MDFNDYIKTYEDLARQVGGMVLANEIAKRPFEPVGGSWEDEIYQFYIVSDPSFLLEHTDEPVFYDSELDLYIWGITHFGTAWDYVPAPELH